MTPSAHSCRHSPDDPSWVQYYSKKYIVKKYSKVIIAPTDFFFLTAHHLESTKNFSHPHASMPMGEMKSFDKKVQNIMKTEYHKRDDIPILSSSHCYLNALVPTII